MYKICIISKAKKDLDNFQDKIFTKIKKIILSLADNPRPYGAIKLTNEEGYRIRVGDYRILYRIVDQEKEIYIYRVKHRKDAYRQPIPWGRFYRSQAAEEKQVATTPNQNVHN